MIALKIDFSPFVVSLSNHERLIKWVGRSICSDPGLERVLQATLKNIRSMWDVIIPHGQELWMITYTASRKE
jgi:hypothetical protein